MTLRQENGGQAKQYEQEAGLGFKVRKGFSEPGRHACGPVHECPHAVRVQAVDPQRGAKRDYDPSAEQHSKSLGPARVESRNDFMELADISAGVSLKRKVG
jgi:hypothetical protein